MVVGIIAEYNPFHNGHRYQIEQIRKRVKNASIIVIMSGNFTQRGETAILNKFKRAELAVKGGCDLVLELPFVSAVRSAQDFAYGSVNLLKNLGIVDFLAFGAEINDIDILQKASDSVDNTNFKSILKDNLDVGASYAKAMCQTLSKIAGIHEKITMLPNVILAIEYLKVLKITDIKPILIPRSAVGHDDRILHAGISSASSIRDAVHSKNPIWNDIAKTINNDTLIALRTADLPIMENLYRPLITKIICSNTSELKDIYGINEGLENKLIEAAYLSKNLEEFINFVVSRRYTRSRIQRLLLYILTGLKKEQIKYFDEINYARILAFNQRGREIIKEIKKSSQIPVITKIAQHITSRAIYKKGCVFEMYKKKLLFDIISSNIFAISYKNLHLGQDFINSPIYCKNSI